MSPMLQDFYNDVNYALKMGENRPEWFKPWTGLCFNLRQWCFHNNTGDIIYDELDNEMGKQFENAGLHFGYPFNSGDGNYYDMENNKFDNAQRLAWIKNHV